MLSQAGRVQDLLVQLCRAYEKEVDTELVLLVSEYCDVFEGNVSLAGHANVLMSTVLDYFGKPLGNDVIRAAARLVRALKVAG